MKVKPESPDHHLSNILRNIAHTLTAMSGGAPDGGHYKRTEGFGRVAYHLAFSQAPTLARQAVLFFGIDSKNIYHAVVVDLKDRKIVADSNDGRVKDYMYVDKNMEYGTRFIYEADMMRTAMRGYAKGFSQTIDLPIMHSIVNDKLRNLNK